MQKISRIFLYFFWFILLSLVSGYITFKIMSHGRLIMVPELNGKSLKEAEEILKKNGLSLRVTTTEYDIYVPEGYILSQEIEPGSSITGKVEVGVTLSKGPMTYLTPNFIGRTLDEAKGLFIHDEVKISNIIEVHSETVEKGRIIAQEPLGGEKAISAITLLVSSGAYDIIYLCPSFKGMSKEDADSLASELGLRIEFEEEGEIVKSQMPPVGALINTNSVIKLQLERNPDTSGRKGE